MGGWAVPAAPWIFLIVHTTRGWYSSRRAVRGWDFLEPFPGAVHGEDCPPPPQRGQLLLFADENLLWGACPWSPSTPLPLFLEGRTR